MQIVQTKLIIKYRTPVLPGIQTIELSKIVNYCELENSNNYSTPKQNLQLVEDELLQLKEWIDTILPTL